MYELGSEFQKSKSGFGFRILEILGAPIFRQNEQLWIFGPKFTQKWILGCEFQKSKSAFRINTSNIPCVPIFSQNGKLLIFWSKFGEIVQLRGTFWFKYCWGCCRELDGGWNELDGSVWSWVGVEMSWVEVDGAGWRWVHGLVIHFSKGPSLLKKIKQTFLKGECPTLKRDSNTGVFLWILRNF